MGPFSRDSSHTSSRQSNSTRSPSLFTPSVRNIDCPVKTCDVTDSGYSSKTNHQLGSLNLLSATASPQQDSPDGLQNVGMTPLFPSSSVRSPGGGLSQNQTYARSLKESLEESESKRLLLLEKMREAHLTIQVVS